MKTILNVLTETKEQTLSDVPEILKNRRQNA